MVHYLITRKLFTHARTNCAPYVDWEHILLCKKEQNQYFHLSLSHKPNIKTTIKIICPGANFQNICSENFLQIMQEFIFLKSHAFSITF